MPPRLNKRQQRELEELSALALTDSKPSHSDNEGGSHDDKVAPEVSAQVTTELSRGGVGFAALAANNEANHEEESQEEKTTAQVRVKSKKVRP